MINNSIRLKVLFTTFYEDIFFPKCIFFGGQSLVLNPKLLHHCIGWQAISNF